MKTEIEPLIGEWVSGPADLESIRLFGKVSLEFKPDNTMIQTIHGDEKDEIIYLTFDVHNGYIITNQPSHPSKEFTAYYFVSDDELVLTYEGTSSRFVRKTPTPLQ